MNNPHLMPEGWRYESLHKMNKALPGWDYCKPWIYMITMVVTGRRRLLGRLRGEMGTTRLGCVTTQDRTEAGTAMGLAMDAPSSNHSGALGLGPVLGGVTAMPQTEHVTAEQEQRLPMNSPLRAGSNIVATTKAWVELSPLGRKVEECIRSMETFHPEIRVMKVTIMEDHVHFIVHVQRRLPKPLGSVIGSVKRACVKAYRELQEAETGQNLRGKMGDNPLFEERFTDSILFHRGQLQTMLDYLDYNPVRLFIKRNMPELFRQPHEVTAGGRTYMAVGNEFLLQEPTRVPVKVHRRIEAEALESEKAYYLSLAQRGAVLVSPCISPGEQTIMREARLSGYRIIVLMAEGFSPMFKPQRQYLDACMEGRLLMLSPWAYVPGRHTVSAVQCQELNAMAKELATMPGLYP